MDTIVERTIDLLVAMLQERLLATEMIIEEAGYTLPGDPVMAKLHADRDKCRQAISLCNSLLDTWRA